MWAGPMVGIKVVHRILAASGPAFVRIPTQIVWAALEPSVTLRANGSHLNSDFLW